MPEELAVLLLFSFALFVNVPLGFLRRSSRRWSLPWWIGCDGSVPMLWVARHLLEIDAWAIGPEIALALAGNILGPRVLLALTRRPATEPVTVPVLDR